MIEKSKQTNGEVPYEILSGDFGKEVATRAGHKALGDYKGAKILLMPTLDKRSGDVVCINPYSNVLMNSVLRDYGKRTATLKDMSNILKYGLFEGSLSNADIGLYVTGEEDPNPYLAKKIVDDIRDKTRKFEFPAIVNLSDLELVLDEDAPHGVGFKLVNGARPIYAPTLKSTALFYRESLDKETGVPMETHKEIPDAVEGVIYNGRLEQRGLSRLSCLKGFFPLGGFLRNMGALCYLDGPMRVFVTDIEKEKSFNTSKLKIPENPCIELNRLNPGVETEKTTVLDMEHGLCDLMGSLNEEVPQPLIDIEEGKADKYWRKK